MVGRYEKEHHAALERLQRKFNARYATESNVQTEQGSTIDQPLSDLNLEVADDKETIMRRLEADSASLENMISKVFEASRAKANKWLQETQRAHGVFAWKTDEEIAEKITVKEAVEIIYQEWEQKNDSKACLHCRTSRSPLLDKFHLEGIRSLLTGELDTGLFGLPRTPLNSSSLGEVLDHHAQQVKLEFGYGSIDGFDVRGEAIIDFDAFRSRLEGYTGTCASTPSDLPKRVDVSNSSSNIEAVLAILANKDRMQDLKRILKCSIGRGEMHEAQYFDQRHLAFSLLSTQSQDYLKSLQSLTLDEDEDGE